MTNTFSLIKDIKDQGHQNKKRLKTATYENVVEAVIDWLKAARILNLPVSSTLITQKALEFATHLRETNSKVSTGWLDK